MKNILITSGGTKEYIDNVRVMTNISSGKLGSLIAQKLSQNKEYKIWYLHGEDAFLPDCPNRDNPLAYISVKSANDAMVNMRKIVTEEKIDVVIHAMAVSDFTFKKDSDIKLKSSDPDAFVEYMKETITPNPKIIGMIKGWNPTCILIGFKFEVDIDHSELIDLARQSIQKNGCDLVIANDKKEMERMRSHIAYFVYSEDMQVTYGVKGKMVQDKMDIANEIFEFINKIK